MGLISWIILGGIAGWIATIIMGNNGQHGIVYNIIVGIFGAIIGGFIAQLLGVKDAVSGFNFVSIIVAILGSVLLIWIMRRIGGRKHA